MKKVTKAQSRAIWLYQVSSQTGEKVEIPEGVLSTSFEFPEGSYAHTQSTAPAGNGLWLLVSWLEDVVVQDSQVPLPIPADAS